MAVADYLESVIDITSRKVVINQIVQKIQAVNPEFDAIAFRGMSGALVAPEVATELGKEIIIVRKADNAHSSYKVEMLRGTVGNYIIVDDLIATGKTITAIRRKLPGRKCVGIFLYTLHCQRNGEKYGNEHEIPVYFCLDK